MKRPLTESEKIAVSRMAETLPEPQRSQITDDLAHALAEPLNEDSSVIRFEIEGYPRLSRVGRTMSVDATATDRDGAHLNVILFADESGRLYELEIVRFENGNVIAPDWTTLKFY